MVIAMVMTSLVMVMVRVLVVVRVMMQPVAVLTARYDAKRRGPAPAEQPNGDGGGATVRPWWGSAGDVGGCGGLW